MLKRTVVRSGLYLGASVVFSALSPVNAEHKEQVVHLYNWEEFLSPLVIDKLEQEHKILIEQLYFSDEAVRDELLLSERGKSLDIVVVESVQLQRLGKLGVVKPIKALKNQLSARFQTRWAEACGDYGLPYAWGTSGILYRADKFAKPVTSWKALLEPDEQFKGKVSMYYHPIDLVGAALLASNIDPFSSDDEHLKIAYKALQTQRNYLGTTDYILNETEKPDQLRNIDIAFGFSGDHYILNVVEPNAQWRYVVPNEGTTVWLECLALPAGSRSSEKAITTLDFLTSPEVAALNAQNAWFSSPNQGIRQFLDEDYLNDPIISPNPSLIEKSYLYRAVNDSGLVLRQRIVDDLR